MKKNLDDKINLIEVQHKDNLKKLEDEENKIVKQKEALMT